MKNIENVELTIAAAIQTAVILGSLALVATIIHFTQWIPFDLFQFWFFPTDYAAAGWAILPLIGWGIFLAILPITDSDDEGSVLDVLESSFLRSMFAGVSEEIIYRWLGWYTSIVFISFFNKITFGLTHWVNEVITAPFTNFITFGKLHEYIFYESDWTVGAALIAVTASFRDGHKYQGFFGTINAWFAGFYLFWITLHYGIMTAMFVHFAYDMIIFTVSGLKPIIRRLKNRRADI